MTIGELPAELAVFMWVLVNIALGCICWQIGRVHFKLQWVRSDERISRALARTEGARVIAEDQVAQLRDVLREHHEWHQNIGTVWIRSDAKKGPAEYIELDLSDGYADSLLCERTMKVLR